MGDKDIQEKLLEDCEDVFADIVNVLGFQGARIVTEESLVPGPTVSIYKAQDGRNREQLRDVTKFDTKLGAVMMLLGLENQTDVDYDMVFRVMRYDGASYKIQEDEAEKYPVITWVLYFGMKRWRAPKSIHEAIIKGFPNWKKMIRTVPNYHINLIEVAFLPKEIREQLTSDFRIIADYFYAVRTGTEREFYEGPEGKRRIRHVEAMMDFLQAFAQDSRYADMKETFCKNVRKEEDITMCSMLDYAENKGAQRGLEQGLQEGLQEGLQKGIQALIEAGLAFGQTYDSTLNMVMEKYSMDAETAKEKMQLYWKERS